MRIFIEPVEPLLFRTGRPFDAGESNFAESIFPPTPETIQGAIRAMIAAHTTRVDRTLNITARFGSEVLKKLIGDQDGCGRFRITGFALGKRLDDGAVERLLPAPASLVKVKFKGDKDPTVVRLRLKPLSGVSSNMPDHMQYLTFPDFGKRKLEGKPESAGWLAEHDLHSILNTQDDFPQIKPESEFYTYESRLGIGMQNATKTTETGYLYQVQMIRMQPGYGFVVDIGLSEENNPSSLIDDSQTQQTLGLSADTGWLTLGGEQRAAYFTVLGITPLQGSMQGQKAGKIIYLATPAYFSRGWKPPAGTFPPDSKLLAAAVNNPISIGGWQLNPRHAGGSSKMTRRCVPAGSVYFFDKPVLVTRPLTEYGEQIGYGIAYTGGLDHDYTP